MSQARLADAVGLDQTTISDLENGRSRTTGKTAEIAHALGVDPHWLATGQGSMEPLRIGGVVKQGVRLGKLIPRATDTTESPAPAYTSNVERAPAIRGQAPEISWVQAGAWAEVCHVESDPEAITWHPRVAGGENTFVLRVVGDSMLPDYPPGRLIFVDPERRPENGDDVIAVLTDTDEATFKRLIEEPGSGRMLKALNPAWRDPYLPINGNCRIIGVVVADMRLR